jgi:menaquinol-cytochrome c reductase cytochrome b/c subunit
MAEIPEHLRKRAEEARKKAEAKKAAEAGEAAAPAAPAADAGGSDAGASDAGDSRIPAHLLERSKAAKAAKGTKEPAGVSSELVGASVGGAAAAVAAAAPPPTATGPSGHTQRLLTVVKSGSIQDVKATPVDKVHVWPHLLAVEFVAALAVTAFTLIFSIFVNAPLLAVANVNDTPNPSKAPWYFLGLQELLTMFHPMVAGVTIPGMGIFLLILAPYVDRNPSNKPEDRKFAIALFTVQMMFWAVLTIISSFFRGPGYNFVLPWNEGLFFEL